MKYSVVIPVYNTDTYLSECVNSVLLQKECSDFEIILVDDGSTDKSGEICDDFAFANSNIKVIHTSNQWLSHARNVGILNASGEYILFLDSDDFWEKDFLKTFDEIILNDPDIGMISRMHLFEDGHMEAYHLPIKDRCISGKEYLDRLFSINKAPCTNVFCYGFRREFIIKNDLLFVEDLRSSEDFEFEMRAIPLANSISSCDKPLYNYHVGRKGSLSSTLTVKKLMDNLIIKAEVFGRYKVIAIDNMYCSNALLIAKFAKNEYLSIRDYLAENRDIWKHTSGLSLWVEYKLISVFGDFYGAKTHSILKSIFNVFRRK